MGVVCALVLVALIGSVLMAVAIAQRRRMAATQNEDAKSEKSDDDVISSFITLNLLDNCRQGAVESVLFGS